MWNWIKVPKIAAILAFALPWMTVSCSGTPLAEATGFQLAFGNITTMGRASGKSADLNIWLIAAVVVIAIGLIIALMASRRAAISVLVTSVAALGLIQLGLMHYTKRALIDKADRHDGGDGGSQMADTALSLLQIEWHAGYYICVSALAVSGVMAFLVMTGRDKTG